LYIDITVTGYLRICAISRSWCAVGRSLFGATIDRSRNNRRVAFANTWT